MAQRLDHSEESLVSKETLRREHAKRKHQVYDLKAVHDRQKKKQGKSDDIIRRQTALLPNLRNLALLLHSCCAFKEKPDNKQEKIDSMQRKEENSDDRLSSDSEDAKEMNGKLPRKTFKRLIKKEYFCPTAALFLRFYPETPCIAWTLSML